MEQKKVERWQLDQRQSLSLQDKIILSNRRIRAWDEYWDGEVFVSFSGGLDSTVLLHLVRSMYPDTPAVFSNTGLEYPENVRFVRQFENVHVVRPDKSFKRVIEEYGYPVVSKKIAQYLHEVRTAGDRDTATKRLRMTGWTSKGTYSQMSKIPDKWTYLVGAPFKISNRCCHWLKKRPLRKIVKIYGAPFVGTRAEESQDRSGIYLKLGCNAYEIKSPRSTPLAFWMHEDIKNYIQLFDLAYSPLYDMGYERSGCMFCAFGVHLESYPNRFQRMQDTHPKWWSLCMDRLGLREVLQYLRVGSEMTHDQLSFLDMVSVRKELEYDSVKTRSGSEVLG